MNSERTRDTAGHVVVVGAGQAGGDLAAALRMSGHRGAITIVGDESTLPYSRPPLSKAFLAGDTDERGILLRDPETYDTQTITVRTGQTVRSIDRAGHRIDIDGEWLGYDKLVLATGGRPRLLNDDALTGAGNVFALRTVADASRLRERLIPGARLVIVGGGYIGLEIASAARARGVEVTVLEAAERVLARVTSPVMSNFFETVHSEEGVHLIVDAKIDGFDLRADGDVIAVRLVTGEVLAADAVLVGIGLIPRTELAEASGLDVDNGIVVDRRMHTSDPDIFAIGDVARHPDLQRGGMRRLESVPNASEQARIVAAEITGKVREYDSVPWFWSDQYDCKLQVAGLSAGYDSQIVRQDPSKPRRITVLYLQNDRVICADVVNNPADFAVAKKLIMAAAPVDRSALADIRVPLKAALAAAQRKTTEPVISAPVAGVVGV